MSDISNKKKKFIKRNFRQLTVEALSRQTGLKPHIISSLINEFRAEKPKKNQPNTTPVMSNAIASKKQFFTIMVIGAVVIFLITCIVYFPALKNEFINWDDDHYVQLNKNIHSLNFQSLYWMLTSFHSYNWHPLTWLSHAIDYAFWALNPFGHHLTNILLHGVNTVVVFLLCARLVLRSQEGVQKSLSAERPPANPIESLWIASITALLFGLHPLRVESVAWIAERKDLLCAFFFLLTILFYLSYTASPVKKNQRVWYLLCLLFFVFSLMSKPMAVTLPAILLLLDTYPLKRLNLYSGKGLSVVLEKIPFFACSVASSIITIVAQRSGGALRSLAQSPLDARLLNAAQSVLFYLEKLFIPLDLVPFYPFPADLHGFYLPYLLSVLLFFGITGGCLWLAKRGNKLFFTAWTYYVVTLLPVLGIIKVGEQAAADRYTYLPSLSIYLLLGVGISWVLAKSTLVRHKSVHRGVVLFVLFILMILSLLTVRQIKVWHTSEIFWNYVIHSFPKRVPLAYNNLGYDYYKKSRLDEAIFQYNQALAIKPDFVFAHNNLGMAYRAKGMVEEAIYAYKQALAIKPDFANAHNNLSVAYYYTGNYTLAIEHCDRALELNCPVHPNYLELLEPHR